jgi:hypothetical protein
VTIGGSHKTLFVYMFSKIRHPSGVLDPQQHSSLLLRMLRSSFGPPPEIARRTCVGRLLALTRCPPSTFPLFFATVSSAKILLKNNITNTTCTEEKVSKKTAKRPFLDW